MMADMNATQTTYTANGDGSYRKDPGGDPGAPEIIWPHKPQPGAIRGQVRVISTKSSRMLKELGEVGVSAPEPHSRTG